MVLTNFELWAADGNSGSLPLDFESNARHLNPFDPRVVPQLNSNLNHLSSNGYYGFSYVNAAHNVELNNNNNNISNINHNNNNTTTFNLMANDVNGINNTTTNVSIQQIHASSVIHGSTANAAAGRAVNGTRCKKRFFVMNDDNDCAADNNYYNSNNNSCEVSAKRCRFDDDFSAQYCNDFFQLPSTQIATQSCLMDTEEEGLTQQQQQQYHHHNQQQHQEQQQCHQQLQSLQEPQTQLQLQQQQQELSQPLQQQQQQEQHLYHQQQHYQEAQIATVKCHSNHNYNNNCNTLALNNNHTCETTCLEKNTEKVRVLKNYKSNENNSIQNENYKYDHDDDQDVANDFKVDDATLFAQLHGGCLHHHRHHYDHDDHHFNTNVSFSGDYIIKKDAINNHLQDNNFYEEF